MEKAKSFDDWEGIRLVKADWIAANGDKSVPWSSFDRQTRRLSKLIVDGMYEGFEPFFDKIEDAFGKVFDRLKAAEAALAEATHRLNELELAEHKTLADAYRGSWQPQNDYKRGCLVTWAGSLWLAMADTSEKPGSVDAWRQITQRGKDAPASRAIVGATND